MGDDPVEMVRRATDELLGSPDWTVNMSLCDKLNRDLTNGAAVVEAIRKRLKHKNPEVGILALSLLDTIAKNSAGMHKFIANDHLMSTLIKLLDRKQSSGFFRKKLDGDSTQQLELKERTLVLIQAWGQSFARSRSYPIFKKTYDDLQRQGVRFPKPHKDELAPVFTPPVKIPVANAPPKPPVAVRLADAEARAANENADVLWDMVTASESSGKLRKNDLVQELVRSVRAAGNRMQARLQRGDGALAELLAVNEKVVAVLKYYDGVSSDMMRREGEPDPAEEKKKREKEEMERAVQASKADEERKEKEREDRREKKRRKKEQRRKKKRGAPVLDLFGDGPPAGNDDDDDDDDSSSDSDSDSDSDSGKEVDEAAARRSMAAAKLKASAMLKKKPGSSHGSPVIPRLAPPPSEAGGAGGGGGGHSRKNSSRSGAETPPKKSAPSGDVLDIFGGGGASEPAAKAPKKGNVDPFDPFAALDGPASPVVVVGPGGQQAKTKQDEEDDDDPFLSLAMRKSPQAKPKEPPAGGNPFGDVGDGEDDPFAALANR